MAKQVVLEIHNSKSVTFNMSYEFDPELIGKKEREEIVHQLGTIKTVKYWVRVPNLVSPITPEQFKKEKDQTKVLAKKAQWKKLSEEKLARMEKYAKMVKNWEEISFTDEDVKSASALQRMSLRAQKKSVCKLGN